MANVAVFARMKTKEGRGEELVAAFEPILAQVDREPGTLLYVLHRSKDDPDLLWVSELYSDDAAFAAHLGSDAFSAAASRFGELIAESELVVGEPVSGKGVPA